MTTYTDLIELALVCARQARQTARHDVAMEFWRMALEYRAKAAHHGEPPDIGPPPPWTMKD